MPANRVEELERSVEELQSTVSGLTDELVEAKERIRVLEAELDTDAPTRIPEDRTEGIDAETAPTESAFEDDEVPAGEASAGEASAGEESAGEEAEDSGTSDIIVA